MMGFKRKIAVWGIALLTVVNVASLTTMAYYRWGDGKDRRSDSRRERRPSLDEQLGLTEAQSKQMKTLRSDLENRIQPLRTAMDTRRERFYALLMASEPDRQEIDRAQGEIDSLQSEIKHLVVDHMLAHKNILTPEQQKQFFDMLKKRFSRDYGERKR